jgi:hypothetical protein
VKTTKARRHEEEQAGSQEKDREKGIRKPGTEEARR